jgi:hypothetical protein
MYGLFASVSMPSSAARRGFMASFVDCCESEQRGWDAAFGRGGERHGRRVERSREMKRPILSISAHLEHDVELVPHRPLPPRDPSVRRPHEK